MDTPVTHYARAGDTHIAYQTLGDGDIDILLVPNWITHVEAMWTVDDIAKPIRRLAQFARVIVYDQRGTGMSDPVPLDRPATFEDRIADAIAVLDAVGVERAAVLAWETGGLIGAVLAATRPDRVSALIFANGFARVKEDDGYEGIPASMIDMVVEQLNDQWGRPTAGEAGEREPTATERHIAETWARYQRQAASPGTAAAMVRLGMEADVRSVLPTISVPTCVLVYDPPGDQLWKRRANGEHIAAHVPGAEYVDIGGEHPRTLAVFVDEIRAFLTGAREPGEPDRVLATLMFSDIVNSTVLASQMGDRAWRELLDAHDAMVRRQLQRFGGTEIKTLGDGFLARFAGPAQSIRCGLAMCEAAQRLGIEVRVGVHTGEVEIRGADVGGIAVHIASRVSGRAGASEVLVSRTVADLVAGSGIQFEDRGSHELKGVPGTWQLMAVTG